MGQIPLFGTYRRRQGRGPILRKWLRRTCWTLLAIPTLYYLIHGYFWVMAIAGDGFAIHVISSNGR